MSNIAKHEYRERQRLQQLNQRLQQLKQLAEAAREQMDQGRIAFVLRKVPRGRPRAGTDIKPLLEWVNGLPDGECVVDNQHREYVGLWFSSLSRGVEFKLRFSFMDCSSFVLAALNR
ncbi:hypothetical protein ACW7BJ_01730 [Azospirillum argentinense]